MRNQRILQASPTQALAQRKNPPAPAASLQWRTAPSGRVRQRGMLHRAGVHTHAQRHETKMNSDRPAASAPDTHTHTHTHCMHWPWGGGDSTRTSGGACATNHDLRVRLKRRKPADGERWMRLMRTLGHNTPQYHITRERLPMRARGRRGLPTKVGAQGRGRGLQLVLEASEVLAQTLKPHPRATHMATSLPPPVPCKLRTVRGTHACSSTP